MTDGDRHGTGTAGGDPLEAAFAAARAVAAEPAPATLLARIEADARAVLAPEAAPAPAPVHDAAPALARRRRPARPGTWRDLVQALGGWPGIGGLATASAAGVWLGLAAPAALDGLGLPGTAGIDDSAAETFADGLLSGGYFSTLEEG